MVSVTQYLTGGLQRPRDGSGRGIGMFGGRRANRNTKPCTADGPGFGQGGGRGKGQNRVDDEKTE